MRRVALCVVAAVAASVWMVPAANASEASHCEQEPWPEQNVVVIQPGQISVHPENAPGFTTGLADVYIDYLICNLHDILGPTANCPAAFLANRPTVTVSIDPPSVTIDYDDFIHTQCQ